MIRRWELKLALHWSCNFSNTRNLVPVELQLLAIRRFPATTTQTAIISASFTNDWNHDTDRTSRCIPNTTAPYRLLPFRHHRRKDHRKIPLRAPLYQRPSTRGELTVAISNITTDWSHIISDRPTISSSPSIRIQSTMSSPLNPSPHHTATPGSDN